MARVFEVSFKLAAQMAGNFASTMKNGAGGIKALNEQVNVLGKNKTATQNLIDLRRTVAQSAKEYIQAKQRVAELGRQISQTTNPTRAMKNEFKAAELAVNRAKTSLQGQRETLKQLNTQMGTTNTSTADLVRKQQELERSSEKARAAQERLERSSERLAKTTQALMSASKAGMAVTAAVATGAGIAAKTFMDAESAATDLKSSMMISDGSVSKDFGKINALANKLGATLPGTTAEFTQMMNVLVKEGIPAQSILNGMGEAAANLGVVMKMEYPEAAKFVAQLADATKVASSDMMEFMDQVQRMSHTGLDADYMLQGFGKMSAGMKTARLEGIKGVKAMAPFLAMLGNAGMTDGGSAGNAVSKILSASVKSTEKAMEDYKKEFGKNAPQLNLMKNGEFAGIQNMYKELDKLKNLTTEERNFYISKQFGNDAETIQALNIMIGKGQKGYDEMVKKMESQASLQKRVAIQLGTMANLWDAAKGSFDAILISVGEAFAPELKNAITWMSSLQEKILAWKTANPELFKTIVKVTLGITGIVAGLSALSLAFVATIGPMVFAFRTASTVVTAATGVFKLFNLALLSNPITWVVVGIVALIAAGVLLYKNWDAVKAKAIELWGVVKNAWSAGVASIKQKAAEMWASVKASFMNLSIVQWVSAKWNAAKVWLTSFTLRGAVIAIINGMKTAFLSFTPLGLIISAFMKIKSWLSGFSLFESGRKLLETLAAGIRSAVSVPVAAIKGALQKVRQYLPFSDAKEGPLSQLTASGMAIMNTLSQGMAKVNTDQMMQPFNKTTSGMMGQIGGSNGNIDSIVSSKSSSVGTPAGSSGGGQVLQLTQNIYLGSGAGTDAREQARQGAAEGANDLMKKLEQLKQREDRLAW